MKLGRLLVEMADRIIGSGGAKARPADFLSRVLSEAGVKAFSDPLGAVRFPAPEVIWQAWKRPGSKQWDYIKRYVEVIAEPKEVLERPLVTGDILVRIALGEPGLGHLALVADPRLWRWEELAGAGLTPEGRRPGKYVQVVEAGVRPHRLEDGFARCLGNENGQLSHDSLIVRIVGAAATEREFLEDAPKTPPPPLSFKFNSTVIPKYQDEEGTQQVNQLRRGRSERGA